MDDAVMKPGASGDEPRAGLPNDRTDTVPPPSAVEWGARIASVSLMALLVGYLLYLCLRPQVPAQFDVAPDYARAELRNGVWVLPVEVSNSSTESVTDVAVEITLAGADGEVARSTTIYILGEGESAMVEMQFPERPTEGNTEAVVGSYQSP